ncbi:MAG: hypothetical protein JWN34_5961 [Bryobacterales bacterium]|nr:hypothetical protein [Bryobacterales bacterium]
MFSVLRGRDHLIFRLFVLCAFRHGELFALRWKSLHGATLQVDASLFRGQLGSPKTKSSEAAVAVPDSSVADLLV